MATAPSSEKKIPFTCPYCGHHTDVEARFAGQSGPCVSCSNTVTVPALDVLLDTPPGKSTPTKQPAWIKVGMVVGGMLSLGVLGVVLWSVLQPAFDAARDAARCSACESNLRDIGRAIEDYYQERGSYPPAVVYGDNGKPMHSWRVLLLPYLGPEGRRVYDLYDMDKPWDSKQNMMLVREIPHAYVCPSDAKAILGETSYLAVVGAKTLINNTSQPTKRTGDYDGPVLRDSNAETMVILEASGSAVNWMEPKDIPMAALRAGLNSSNPAGPGSQHEQGVNVLMADQSIIRLPDTTSSDDLRAMATIDGGNEYIEVLDDLDY